jgi:glycogen phosphorylase
MQAKVDTLYQTQEAWAQRVCLNIAGMGGFSSDRTIREYLDHVWLTPSAR